MHSKTKRLCSIFVMVALCAVAACQPGKTASEEADDEAEEEAQEKAQEAADAYCEVASDCGGAYPLCDGFSEACADEYRVYAECLVDNGSCSTHGNDNADDEYFGDDDGVCSALSDTYVGCEIDADDES